MPAPNFDIALLADTGSSSTDGVTSNPAIGGIAEPNALVTIYEGGVTLGTAIADGTGAWSFTPAGLADGAHNLRATATDPFGKKATATLHFTLDTAAPLVSVALVTDTGNSSTDGITSNPAITGVGQANSLVTIYEGGVKRGTAMADGTGAWSFTPVGLTDGNHTLIASQTDLAGNTGTAVLSLTLDSTAMLSMSLVSDTGSSTTDGITSNPAIGGIAEPNTLVTIYEGGITLGTVMADGTGVWSFTPGLADGTHVFSATETDLAGNTVTATLSFTLDTVAPAGVHPVSTGHGR